MCGINAIISQRKVLGIENRIHTMNKSIAHRGPDDDAVWCNSIGNIAFGHCRLSVIDLEQRARQPMISNSGRWLIMFNGEIYNYNTLRGRTNYCYKTCSDTEVILAYVEEFGVEQFLKDGNGMFSIGLYDFYSKHTYICRDRMGIKPLFYFKNDEQLIFSSEIKGILNSGLIEPEFNEAAIDEYLGNRFVRAPYSFFKNIYQILPGTYMRFDAGLNTQEVRYWQLPVEFNIEEKYDEARIEDEFHERLLRAVKDRMIADVPVGTYLSGGVDSSIISAIAASHTGKELNTYTIGFEEMNEFSYAR